MNIEEQRIAVLIAVFNRWHETERLLEQLQAIEKHNFHLDIWICDDGSTDETQENLMKHFPEVNVVKTKGNLFWAKSMNQIDVKSFEFEPDFTLWLNNDTVVHEDLFLQFRAAINDMGADSIFVGALMDPITKEVTYSGCVHYLRNGKDELHFIPPLGTYVKVGMFSGNCVLVPKTVRREIGPISKNFSHGWADMEYGFRAIHRGFDTYLLPTFAGSSPLNHLYSIHTDPSKKIGERLRHAFGRKGYQPVDYFKFCFASFPFSRAIKIFISNLFRMAAETLLPSFRRT